MITESLQQKTSYLPGSLLIIKNPAGNLLSRLALNEIKGQTILLVSSGTVFSTVNYLHMILSGQYLILFPDIKCIDQLDLSDDFEGSLLVMSDEFVEKLHFNLTVSQLWKTHSNLFYRKIESAEADGFASYFDLLTDAFENGGSAYREDIVWMLSKALTFKIISLFSKSGKMEVNPNDGRKQQIVRSFTSLILQYGLEHRDIEFYANKLCISPKYLSHAVVSVTGENASKMIESYIVEKAKLMLSSTDLNVSQIANALNFTTSSDFCRYFKTRTGQSPNTYRRKERDGIPS